MKKITIISTLIIMLLLLPFASSKSEEPVFKRKITVTGSADVKAKPDLVTFKVGVETWNKNLNQAKKLNDENIKQIFSIAKKSNVLEKNIQTSYLNISPTHQNDRDEKIKGFQVRNFAAIELSDFSLLDRLITDFIEAGLTNIYGIEFSTSEPRKYKGEARKLAIKAAKEKAEEMVGELGMKVGKALEIIENSFSGWGAYSNVAVDKFNESKESTESTTQKGEIIIRASVTVTFEIE